jgi:hypothetical protein
VLMLLATWSFTTSRRLFQIGILLAGIGSGCIGLGAVGMLFGRPRPAVTADVPPPATQVETVAPPTAPAAAPPAPVAAPAPRATGVFVSPALMVASALLVAGFVLMILAVHWGVSPFSPRTTTTTP